MSKIPCVQEMNADAFSIGKPAERQKRRLQNDFRSYLIMERAKGFEPSTPTLARLCSTPELRPQHDGAPRGTRTPTALQPLGPEPSASTNSATGARIRSRLYIGALRGAGGPGGDLLSHVLRRSTIGAEGFHGRVRNGIGCLAPRHDHQVDQLHAKKKGSVSRRDAPAAGVCGAGAPGPGRTGLSLERR